MHNKPHSQETINKIKNALKNKKYQRKGLFVKGQNIGEKNHNWKGGISNIDRLIRRMPEYKQWRSNVFERDKWACRTCGFSSGYVTAHHIKAFTLIIKENNIKTTEQARTCNEIWDEDNGVTLCEECHALTDNYRVKAKLLRVDC